MAVKAACFGAAILCLSALGAAAQSGRAEVTVAASSAAVKSHLINEMMNRGYSIMSDTPNMVVFDKVADNLAAMFLFGTRFGGAPHARIVYSIAEIGGSTRVMADAALIGNAGSAFERRNDMNSGEALGEVQGILNLVASESATPVAAAAAPAPGNSAGPTTVRELRDQQDGLQNVP